MIIDPPRTKLTPVPASIVTDQAYAGGSHAPQIRSSGRALLLMLAAFTVAVMGLGSWLLLEDHGPEPRMAPPVEFVTSAGDRIALDSLRGHPVVVSFWSDPCAACVAQWPVLAKLEHSLRGRGLKIIAVAGPSVPASLTRDYVERHKLRFPVAIDPSGELANTLGPVVQAPTHVLIDRRGMIVERLQGELSPARLEGRITEALAGR